MNQDPATAPNNTSTEPQIPTSAAQINPSPDFVDRSKLQTIYPQPSSPTIAKASFDTAKLDVNDQSQMPLVNFNDAIVLVSGLASASSVYLVLLIKSLAVIIVTSIILIIVTVVFAMKNYRITGRTSPVAVAGISAATATFLYCFDLLLSHLAIRSLFRF